MDVTWDKETFNVGDELTFTATIVNAGDQAVPAGKKLGVQFQIDNKPWPVPITWNDKWYGGLQPGQVIKLTATSGNEGSAWTATEGTHTVTAWADDAQDGTGYGTWAEANNKCTKSISVPFGGIQYIENPDQPDDLSNLGDIELPTEKPTEQPTKKPTEEPTKKPVESNATMVINGFQISTTVEEIRTIYTVDDPDSEVVNVGLIYGLAQSATPEEMVVSSTNSSVHNYEATTLGRDDMKFSDSKTAASYVMTMKFGTNQANFFNADTYVRAYAKLSDGSYVYSDVKNYTVYKVANYVYQNRLMNNYS